MLLRWGVCPGRKDTGRLRLPLGLVLLVDEDKTIDQGTPQRLLPTDLPRRLRILKPNKRVVGDSA